MWRRESCAPLSPAANLQYWVADVAFISQVDWDSFPLDEVLPVYAPPFIVKILSPSNRPAKMNRQRLVAMSGGTQEFWIVDPDARTVLVTDLSASTVYAAGQTIPATTYHGAIAVDGVFAI